MGIYKNQQNVFLKTKIPKNNVSLCITFRNFPKVPFPLNSHTIPLLGFLTLLTRVKSQDVHVSDYFFVVSKSFLDMNTYYFYRWSIAWCRSSKRNKKMLYINILNVCSWYAALYIEYVPDILHWVCYQLKALQLVILKEL